MRISEVNHNTMDAAGSIVGLLVALAGATGLLEKLNLSATELAEILGILLTLAALIRLKFIESAPKDE